MDAEIGRQDILQSIFIKTVIKEMSKTIDTNTENFYSFRAEIDKNDYDTKIERGQTLISNKSYNFKYKNIKIMDAESNQEYEVSDLEFEFKQTNKVSEDKVKNKQLENLTNYWLGRINSKDKKNTDAVFASNGAFDSVAAILESGDIDSAKVEIKKRIDKLSNPLKLGYSHSPIYEAYRFTSEIKEIKLLPNKTENFIFTEITGEVALVSTKMLICNFPRTKDFISKNGIA
ncbi:hypothetical protein [Spiroplasma alleghenense]|uniref:Uncharacterized protein n=1 Tax=Spiroplasma alleghenense TaxID=216931 RepID=A0A345Z2Y5_9MOLU|nr:hypothetical protein [Spiroplasma alleghenense]AXK50964.1 hypothetical protein SALLE_v1c02900 [Spiroplasma alleghenense]